MNSKMKLVAFLAIAAVAAAGLAAQGILPRLCCVAGEYTGSHILDPLPNCPAPASESFTMSLYQETGCGAKVWGKIVDRAGNVREFKGTLSLGPRGCCKFTASFSDPHPVGHVIEMTGLFCRVAGKWGAKGTYKEINSGDPCRKTGTWHIRRI